MALAPNHTLRRLETAMTILSVRAGFYWPGPLRASALCLLAIVTCAHGGARVDVTVPNADFDAGIDGWSGVSQAEISWEPGEDFEGDPASGALRIRQVRDDTSSAWAQSACFAIGEGTYEFGAHIFVDSAQAGNFAVLIQMVVFDGADCSGGVLASFGTTNRVVATDVWIIKGTSERSIPAGAASAYLRVPIFNESPEPFEVLADGFFIIDTDTVFADRFEQ